MPPDMDRVEERRFPVALRLDNQVHCLSLATDPKACFLAPRRLEFFEERHQAVREPEPVTSYRRNDLFIIPDTKGNRSHRRQKCKSCNKGFPESLGVIGSRDQFLIGNRGGSRTRDEGLKKSGEVDLVGSGVLGNVPGHT